MRFLFFVLPFFMASPAFAQASGQPGIAAQLLPLALIFLVFWFLLIRPQQKRIKEHKEMVSNIRRGDNVITAGGLKGKVTKVVDETELEVEIASKVVVKVARSTIADVVGKPEPVSNNKKSGPSNSNKKKNSKAA